MQKRDTALHAVVLLAFVLIAGIAATNSDSISLSPHFEPEESIEIANGVANQGFRASLWLLVAFFGAVMLALLVVYYVLTRV